MLESSIHSAPQWLCQKVISSSQAKFRSHQELKKARLRHHLCLLVLRKVQGWKPQAICIIPKLLAVSINDSLRCSLSVLWMSRASRAQVSSSLKLIETLLGTRHLHRPSTSRISKRKVEPPSVRLICTHLTARHDHNHNFFKARIRVDELDANYGLCQRIIDISRAQHLHSVLALGLRSPSADIAFHVQRLSASSADRNPKSNSFPCRTSHPVHRSA